jgi:hypothetical protein
LLQSILSAKSNQENWANIKVPLKAPKAEKPEVSKS